MKQTRHGFTLPEVCVALAVFFIGTTAMLGAWNFFNREVADERMRLERFEKVFSTMESLIAERPNCVDSLTGVLSQNVTHSPELPVVSVCLKRVPGGPHLAWTVVECEGFSLKRLVRCR